MKIIKTLVGLLINENIFETDLCEKSVIDYVMQV